MTNNINDYPRLFALFCLPTGSIEFTSTQYTRVQGMLRSMPPAIQDNFEVVRYDPNASYVQTQIRRQ